MRTDKVSCIGWHPILLKFQGRSLPKQFRFFPQKRSTLKGNNLLPLGGHPKRKEFASRGSKFFLFRIDLFSEEAYEQESNQEVTIRLPFTKWRTIYIYAYSVPLSQKMMLDVYANSEIQGQTAHPRNMLRRRSSLTSNIKVCCRTERLCSNYEGAQADLSFCCWSWSCTVRIYTNDT